MIGSAIRLQSGTGRYIQVRARRCKAFAEALCHTNKSGENQTGRQEGAYQSSCDAVIRRCASAMQDSRCEMGRRPGHAGDRILPSRRRLRKGAAQQLRPTAANARTSPAGGVQVRRFATPGPPPADAVRRERWAAAAPPPRAVALAVGGGSAAASVVVAPTATNTAAAADGP